MEIYQGLQLLEEQNEIQISSIEDFKNQIKYYQNLLGQWSIT